MKKTGKNEETKRLEKQKKKAEMFYPKYNIWIIDPQGKKQ